MRRLIQTLALIALFLLAVDGEAAAESVRTHTVHAGQRLGSIAKRYNVSVAALCYANRIEKCSLIRPGQKLIVPDRSDAEGTAARRLVDSGYLDGERKQAEERKPIPPRSPEATKSAKEPRTPTLRTHTVYSGQRLGSIAKRYNVSVDALCGANGMDRTDPIHPGQVLVIPAPGDEDGSDARRRARRQPPASTQNPAVGRKTTRTRASWLAYKKPPWRRGYVHIIGHHASWKGYLVGKGNRVLPAARDAVSRVLAWPHRDKLMASELLSLLATISDTFGGRPLRIVSGYRSRSFARESKHKVGRAVDFRVVGVPNHVVRDYLRTLGNVGVGYYPNSTFLHFDVREAPTYWIDDSGPGQAPRYRHISARTERDE